jgi:hypothetical protein
MTGDIMKRAELIIGKAYYRSKTNEWEDEGYGRYPNITKLAISDRHRKVIVVETQLKTEYDRKYRTRDVLVRNIDGKEFWAPLAHLRGDFDSCIKTRFGWKKEIDNRESKYQQHLARKVQREQYNPAYKAMVNALNELTGDGVYGWDKIENGFSLEQLQTINEALSLLKTQKPTLVAVAS